MRQGLFRIIDRCYQVGSYGLVSKDLPAVIFIPVFLLVHSY
jgi:hypothetical protein